jgi:hypothetical protein
MGWRRLAPKRGATRSNNSVARQIPAQKSLSLCEQLIYFVLLLTGPTACNNNGCWTPHVRRFTEKNTQQLSILLVNWFNAASMDGSFWRKLGAPL